eukprot:6054847-Pyramimonas_sp.AAC.1
MGWGSHSTCGVRLSASRIRFRPLQGFHGLRAARFQHVALALAAHTFVQPYCQSFTDSFSKMWLSP